MDCLSPAVRARVRQVDRVTVKGSTLPMGLFTYDIALDRVEEADLRDPGAQARPPHHTRAAPRVHALSHVARTPARLQPGSARSGSVSAALRSSFKLACWPCASLRPTPPS